MVIWLARLNSPKVAVVAWKKVPIDLLSHCPYLAKSTVKTTGGLLDIWESPFEWLAWLDSPQMAAVARK